MCKRVTDITPLCYFYIENIIYAFIVRHQLNIRFGQKDFKMIELLSFDTVFFFLQMSKLRYAFSFFSSNGQKKKKKHFVLFFIFAENLLQESAISCY